MYRDSLEALAARHATLEQEVAGKTRELGSAAQLLEEARAKALVLDNIRIASPCPAKWDDMTGDDRTRHCASCDKQVFNLSNLTRDEAETLIVERAGNLCVGYFQRADGTILLKDCTVRRRKRLFVAGVGAALALAGSAAVTLQPTAVESETITTVELATETEVIDVGTAITTPLKAPPKVVLDIPDVKLELLVGRWSPFDRSE